MSPITGRQVEILLVEDSPGDVRLTREALRDSKVRNQVHAVADGVDAMAFLRRDGRFASAPRPDLVLLDLNMPRKSGHEVLAEVKGDRELRAIPVVILTSSEEEKDVARAYNLSANCYVTKPMDFQQFRRAVRDIEDFWLLVVRLPSE